MQKEIEKKNQKISYDYGRRKSSIKKTEKKLSIRIETLQMLYALIFSTCVQDYQMALLMHANVIF